MTALPSHVPGVPARHLETLLTTHDTHTVAQQAQLLGLSVRRVENLRAACYAAGVLSPAGRRGNRPWTPERLAKARKLLADGATPVEAAAAVGASVYALQRALREYLDTPLRSLRASLTMEQAAELVGVCHTTFKLYVEAGHLKARRYASVPSERGTPTRRSRRHWHLHRRDLFDLVRVKALWMTYEAADVRDPDLRTAATAARAADPGAWVPLSDIADALGYTTHTLRGWHRERGWPDGYAVARWGQRIFVWIPAGRDFPRPGPWAR